eukprot:8961859-Lingulodinium_polyedra.AAC.1
MRFTGLPWQFAQALPVRAEGDLGVGAAQAAQAMVPPPAFRGRGYATLEAGGPGSVLVRVQHRSDLPRQSPARSRRR